MKKYKPKKGLGIKLLIGIFSIFPILTIIIQPDLLSQSPWLFVLLLIPLALVCWVYFCTSYKVSGEAFYYQSAFIKGEINIHQINQIVKNKTSWSGVKPAMATNGLILKKKYDEIYVAPENNEELINDLLRVNSEIIIIEK
jgi:hypothetical protein